MHFNDLTDAVRSLQTLQAELRLLYDEQYCVSTRPPTADTRLVARWTGISACGDLAT